MIGSKKGDVTGREQMAGNVLAGWGGQSVFILAGFIMPHMIDRRLGQDLLGVWDFAWSLVSYFSLVQLGFVSSINHFVAIHRAKNDPEGVNRAVSSVGFLLFLMAFAVLLLTVGAVFCLGLVKNPEVIKYIRDTRWVVLFLGIEVGVQIVCSIFGGVITGCHRWPVQNGINAASYTLTVVAMITSLYLGWGLPALAFIHLTGEVLSGLTKWFMSYRICPTLKIRYSYASRETVASMFHYGTKTWVPSIGDLILNQSASLMIAASLGPASLAVYSRSRALTRYTRDLVMRMALVLVASVSSLHASGERKQIQELVIKATRYAAFLALPMAWLLIICGSSLLQIWMGNRYATGLVVATLAIGQTATVLQLPALAILQGMNRHGRLSVANLISSIVSVGAVAWVLLALKFKTVNAAMAGVAMAVTVPVLLVNGIYGPLHICRSIELSWARYFRESVWYALLRTLPFAACLLAGQLIFGPGTKMAFLVGVPVGALIMLPIYWRTVIPGSIKTAIRAKSLRGLFGFLEKTKKAKQSEPVLDPAEQMPRQANLGTSSPFGKSKGIRAINLMIDNQSTPAGKLSVCIVSHNAYGSIKGGNFGHIGGVEWQTTLLARWLAQRGHDTSLLTWDEGGPAEEIIDQVRVIKIAREDDGVKGIRFFHPRWSGLIAAMRRANAQVYYHNCCECTTGQVALWCKSNNRRFVFYSANDTDCDPKLPQLKSARERILYRYGLRHTDARIMQTLKQQRNLQNAFGLDSSIIPMPCPLPSDGGEKAPPNGSGRILWIARVCKAKRPDLLLDLAESCPDLAFDLVGPAYADEYAQGVVQRAKGIPNVTVHGGVNRERVASFYRNSALLCCTSDYEGFPNTFLEAWSHGLPIVSRFDPDSLIAKKNLGIAVHDVPELAAGIRSLFASPQRYREISRNAREYVVKTHEPGAVFPQFEKIFQSIVNPERQIPATASCQHG